MSKVKFKTGDLVENKISGEVEMVVKGNTDTNDDYFHIQEYNMLSFRLFFLCKTKHYCLISSKSVKFNLK